MPPSARRGCAAKILPLLLFPVALAHGAEFVSVQEAFSAIQGGWQRVTAYTCLYASHSTLPKERAVTARYAFTKPCSVRMEILTGNGAGTTLLWDGGPKVRLRKKGLLSLFPISLELRNPRLLDPFGEDLSSSSWKFLIEEGARALKEGRLELEAGASPGPLILVHQYPPGAGPFAKNRVYVDRATLLPERVERFDPSGALIEEVWYREVKVDPLLPPDHFRDF